MPLTAEMMKAIQAAVGKGATYEDILALDSKHGPLCLSLKMLRAANPPPGHFLLIEQVAADMIRATAYKPVPVMEGAEARARMRADAIDSRGVTVQTPTSADKLQSVVAMIPRAGEMRRALVSEQPEENRRSAVQPVERPIVNIEDLPTAGELK